MNDLPILTDPALAALPGVRHGFFTRQGGVSAGLYASLNVGLGSKDDPAAVRRNRARIAAHFGVAEDRLLTAYQIHSDKVFTVQGPWAQGLGGDARPEGEALKARLAHWRTKLAALPL